MAGNPLIDQGTLNRIRASVSWNDFPGLNVTPPYLGRGAIKLALDGDSTTFIPTQTGAVTSQQPYQMITLSINLLKTQNLANQYKARMELSTLLGAGVVRPDTTILNPYDIVNCAIESVRELSFDGEDASWMVNIRGYYLINSSMFD